MLNQDYTPLTICSVNRAFLLVYMDKAELLKEEEGGRMRSIDRSFPKPSVIKINRYISVPYKGVVLTRTNVFKRDGNKCQYCGVSKNLTLDHLIPRSKGGKSTWKNLVTACRNCNAKKGDQSPEDMGMTLRQKPIKPNYVMFLKESSGSVREDWRPFLN